ncbi:hypothetical protein BOTCAL_0073g00260 [Botryotinia calthae]|uniref:Uncharacterized protein n=1 Tax=Botryotinia calthae TaxID=38488 RepID=A0A4Y8D8N9_9HELO|nr:hypothetical protein BOTCAL_0073g00260 [Botryotinia calthae]
MGNRRQVYVISKIGSRYRTPATVNHRNKFPLIIWFSLEAYLVLECMFGPDAVELLLNAVHLFQSPQNRIGLEHEKRWATLLQGADNNEGITILDITDIEKIRYCFVNIHSKSDPRAWGNIKSSGAPSMIPLSTVEYMKAYGHEQEHFERDWKEWIRHLSKLDLIDSRTLNSVWPRNTWQLRVGVEIMLLSDTIQESINVLPMFAPPLTLRKACMEKFLKEILNCPIKELPARIERATLLPDFRPALKSAIFSRPKIVANSAAARYLFSQILETEEIIDLELFDTDLYALPFAYRDKYFNDKNSRHYNYRPSAEHGPEEASSTNDIREESQSFMNDMSKFNDLLKDGMPPFCDLGYVTPVIEQMIYITCGKTNENNIRDSEGGLDILDLFQKPFSGVRGPRYLAMPFKEANRHPSQLVEGLGRFIGFSFGRRHFWFSDLRKTMAKILAIEPDGDAGQGSKVFPLCAGLYSDDMCMGTSKHNGIFQITKEIVPNEWTFIMIVEQESYKHKGKEKEETRSRSLARYAFVSAVPSPAGSAPDDMLSTLIFANVKQFLESNFANYGQEWHEDFLRWWEDQVANRWIHPLKFCGRKEIESVIKSIKFTPATEHSNTAYEIGPEEDNSFINCMEKNIDPN